MPTNKSSRREFISCLATLTGASVCIPLRAADSSVKTPKEAVDYQEKPRNGQQCSGCTLFLAESNRCQVVAGEISPEAWCKLYTPKQ